MNLDEALKISTAAAKVDTEMAKLEAEMKGVDGISDTHRRMVSNARQAMSSLVRSLRVIHPAHGKDPDE